MNQSTYRLKAHQQGMATVMLTILLGISVLATSMAVIYTVKGTQQRQITSHAQTNAQSNAWLAIDVVREYYLENANNIPNWLLQKPAPFVFNLNNSTKVTVIMESIVIDVPAIGWYRITSNVLVKDTLAKSASTLQVVTDVLPAATTNGTELDADGSFGSGLTLSGDVNFNIEDGAIFRVDGDITGRGSIGDYSVNIGDKDHVLKELTSTGTINYGSDIYADNVWANEDIILSGGAHGGTLRAVGDIAISGGTRIGRAFANGDVTLKGSSSEEVQSRGNVLIDAGGSNHGSISSLGEITAISANSAKSLSGVKAVNLLINYGQFGLIKSNGDTTCKSAYFSGYLFISTNTVTKCAGANINTLQTPIDVNKDIMAPLTPQVMNPPRANAWPLKPFANYAFELTQVNGKEVQKVTVANVSGIPNGTFDLNDSFIKRYLCDQNSVCIKYISGQKTWLLNHVAFAPGVLWFEGNYESTGNGIRFNTVIATEDIIAEGKTYSVNYDGLRNNGANICGLAYTAKDFGRPTNYCDSNHQFIDPAPVMGYTALYSGGINPETQAFAGGIVEIGAGNEVYGHVVAGDVIKTSGNTVIYGKISASGEGASPTNSLGASTTIDTKDLPDGFLDVIISDEDKQSKPEATISWVRYL